MSKKQKQQKTDPVLFDLHTGRSGRSPADLGESAGLRWREHADLRYWHPVKPHLQQHAQQSPGHPERWGGGAHSRRAAGRRKGGRGRAGRLCSASPHEPPPRCRAGPECSASALRHPCHLQALGSAALLACGKGLYVLFSVWSAANLKVLSAV